MRRERRGIFQISSVTGQVGIGLMVTSLMACGGTSTRPQESGAREGGSDASLLKTGEPAPDVTLTTTDGKRQTLLAAGGDRVVLVDVWATWCQPCRMLAPHLLALHNRYKDQGFSVISILSDDNADEIAAQVAASERPGYPLLVDAGRNSLSRAWGEINALPFLVLIDRQGRVLRIDRGTADFGGIQRAVDAAMHRAPAPTAGSAG